MQTAFSFGSDHRLLGQYAWFLDNADDWSHPVAQLRPNVRGLFDIHGNLREWGHDRYGPYFDDSADDPVGAKGGSYRVYRGGAWDYTATYCQSSSRRWSTPSARGSPLGFRVALVPSDSEEPASGAESGSR